MPPCSRPSSWEFRTRLRPQQALPDTEFWRYACPRQCRLKTCSAHCAIQGRPADLQIWGHYKIDYWDFATDRACLATWRRRAPDCKTFSQAQGQLFQMPSADGPPAFRDDARLEKLPSLSIDKARQRRGEEVDSRLARCGGSLEHPPLVRVVPARSKTPLRRRVVLDHLFNCCYGGHRRKRTALVHLLKALHALTTGWNHISQVGRVNSMNEGQEKEHLRWLLRHVHRTGTSVGLTQRGSEPDCLHTRPSAGCGRTSFHTAGKAPSTSTF